MFFPEGRRFDVHTNEWFHAVCKVEIKSAMCRKKVKSNPKTTKTAERLSVQSPLLQKDPYSLEPKYSMGLECLPTSWLNFVISICK